MSFSIVHLLTGDCSSFGLEVSQPLLLCAPTSSVDYGHIRNWFHIHVAHKISYRISSHHISSGGRTSAARLNGTSKYCSTRCRSVDSNLRSYVDPDHTSFVFALSWLKYPHFHIETIQDQATQLNLVASLIKKLKLIILMRVAPLFLRRKFRVGELMVNVVPIMAGVPHDLRPRRS